MQASESGSLRMAGPTRELLPLAPGRWRLVFAIGREDRLPTDPERVRSLAAHEEHDGLWIEEYRVELTGD